MAVLVACLLMVADIKVALWPVMVVTVVIVIISGNNSSGNDYSSNNS